MTVREAVRSTGLDKFVAIIGGVDRGDEAAATVRGRIAQALDAGGRHVEATHSVVRECRFVAVGHGGSRPEDPERFLLIEAWWWTTGAEVDLPDGTALVADVPGVLLASWVREYPQVIPPESGTGAVLRIYLVNRADDMSREQFGQHWNERHAPLVRSRGPLFEAYVNNVLRGEGGLWDGIGQQWFPDRDEAARHREQARHEKPDVAEDLQRFVSRVLYYETTDLGWRPLEER